MTPSEKTKSSSAGSASPGPRTYSMVEARAAVLTLSTSKAADGSTAITDWTSPSSSMFTMRPVPEPMSATRAPLNSSGRTSPPTMS